MPLDAERFVQNVEYWCKLKGEPPTIACEKSGAGRSLIANIKRGSFPSVAKVQQLAQYLGCTVSDLLGEAQQSAVPESGTLSATELRLLSAYRAAPAPIRAIVDTALEPYEK